MCDVRENISIVDNVSIMVVYTLPCSVSSVLTSHDARSTMGNSVKFPIGEIISPARYFFKGT